MLLAVTRKRASQRLDVHDRERVALEKSGCKLLTYCRCEAEMAKIEKIKIRRNCMFIVLAHSLGDEPMPAAQSSAPLLSPR